MTSTLDSGWDRNIVSEIRRARSAETLTSGAAGNAGGDGNLAEYYASLASRISEETGDTAETETHQPVYNEDLVRQIDEIHAEQSVNTDNISLY